MTQEQIEKCEQLVCRRNDLEARLNWLKGWEENLYEDEPDEDEQFYITITRCRGGKAVLQRDITREEAESEFHSERLRVQKELERIGQEIAAL